MVFPFPQKNGRYSWILFNFSSPLHLMYGNLPERTKVMDYSGWLRCTTGQGVIFEAKIGEHFGGDDVVGQTQ